MHDTNKGHLSGVRCGSSRTSFCQRVSQTEECGLSRSHASGDCHILDRRSGEAAASRDTADHRLANRMHGPTKGPTATRQGLHEPYVPPARSVCAGGFGLNRNRLKQESSQR